MAKFLQYLILQADKVRTNSFRFRLDLFDKVRVIGQVDRKFIAVIGENVNTSTSTNDNSRTNILVLFDQHAVHERIRLEKLICEHYPQHSYVLSSKLETPFDISLSSLEVDIAREYQDKLRNFGLDFVFLTQETNLQFDEEQNSNILKIRVTHVPKCFILREENERKYKRSFSVSRITTILVREIIDKIKSTRGGGLGILPKTIGDILSSRACRGAIKFGDEISMEKCQSLLNELKKCNAPFQCAHGRPSLAPIVELENLQMYTGERKNRPKLNLKSLKNI